MKSTKTINCTELTNSILSTGLIYSPILIKRLAFSLMAKPFVILSGLAGSGKTQLALVFAKCLSENIKEQVCTVSIGADWTNREPLLGYPNALKENEYVLPESGVLQLLMRANEDSSKPYFLILDEMNLSVVERYFADFLSAMESGEKIKLWDNEEGNVPKEIELPKNVFIIGTINVDETTYMFSPKVLDRANVIEFKIAPDEMEQYLNEKKDIRLEKAYSACSDMAEDFVNKAKSQIQIDNNDEKTVLLSFFTELKKVNAEFGYRTVNEISRYLHFADGELSADSAIDTAILQKLLPKLHGSRKKLVPVLTSLWQLCLNNGIAKEIDAEFSATDFKYPESAEKIQRMYKAVVDNGFTSFAEA
jgi:5-methylcytosine-specific restriction protein B